MTTPLKIEILLHYFRTNDIDWLGDQTNFDVRDAFMDLCNIDELLQKDSDRDPLYRITPKGAAYCKALLQVQLPVLAWVIPTSAEGK